MTTSDGVWTAWVTTTSTTSNAVFNNGTALLTGDLTSEAWLSWNTVTPVTVTGTGYYQAPSLAPVQLSARDVGIRANRDRAHAMRARVAQRRAEALLVENLDDTQMEEWEAHGYFHVETADGRRRYQIRRGLAGNVTLVRDGDVERPAPHGIARYCCHVVGPYPIEDNVLTQKLWLESREGEFLRLANVC
jgi:hypothetical protein